MATRTPAKVLIIDDVLDELVLGLERDLRKRKVRASARIPEEVTHDEVASADLVLIDYDLQRWPERDGAALSRRPPDGLALASILRRHIAENGRIAPTAFASYTAQLDKLAMPLPPENRRHILARLSGLEWIFSKTDSDVVSQVQALAQAVHALPHIRPGQAFDINSWLGIDDDSKLAVRYQAEVQDSNPPVYELTEWSHGVEIVRWLLHRVLPYPGFLWDSRRSAMRLRVRHGSLVKALGRKTKLRVGLEKFRYRGALSDFLGPRWWRAGIEHFLWIETDGKTVLNDAIHKVIKRLGGPAIAPVQIREPVLCVNTNYELTADLRDASEAVRVRPDDWPSYAEQPWMQLKDVRSNAALRAIMFPEDRERL